MRQARVPSLLPSCPNRDRLTFRCGAAGTTLTVANYLAVAGGGYATYGSNVTGDLLISYPRSAVIARVALVFVVLLSHPCVSHPVLPAIRSSLSVCCGSGIPKTARSGKRAGGGGGNVESSSRSLRGHDSAAEMAAEESFTELEMGTPSDDTAGRNAGGAGGASSAADATRGVGNATDISGQDRLPSCDSSAAETAAEESFTEESFTEIDPAPCGDVDQGHGTSATAATDAPQGSTSSPPSFSSPPSPALPSPPPSPPFTATPTTPTMTTAATESARQRDARESTFVNERGSVAIISGYLTVTTGTALFVTDLGIVVSLAGAVAATIAVFVAPGACYLSLHRERQSPRSPKMVAAAALAGTGCALMPCLVMLVLASHGYFGAEWSLEGS